MGDSCGRNEDMISVMVGEVLQHLSLMMEHNKALYIERNMRLDALKRRRIALIQEQQQHPQQPQNDNVSRWLGQLGARCQLVPPSPPPIADCGVTNTEWQYHPNAPPSIATGYYSQASTPPCRPPPQQQFAMSQPLATSTPCNQNRNSPIPPGVGGSQEVPTGYLSLTEDDSQVLACGGANPYRRAPPPCSPPANPRGQQTNAGPPLAGGFGTNNSAQCAATEGKAGFQVLHCPECQARLGIVFEIFHLGNCGSRSGNSTTRQ